MRFPFVFGRVAAPALLLSGLVLSAANAQPVIGATPVPSTYLGPRYPGGPDSLRAYVTRQLRAANPAWVGDVFVRLGFDGAGNVQKAEYLAPTPGTPAATLVRNADVQALVTRMVRQMPRWQPAEPAPARGDSQRPPLPFVLRLPFGSSGPVALPYSDQYPEFAGPKSRPTDPYPTSAITHLQREYRYPAEALRNQIQGVMYVYFEVSEAGVIEQRRLVGSLVPSTDAEALRVLQSLPNPSAPPRQQGRPVRVAYTLPVTLKIQ